MALTAVQLYNEISEAKRHSKPDQNIKFRMYTQIFLSIFESELKTEKNK